MLIHTALVSKQSTALHKLVHNDMLEGKKQEVVWDDVEESTFVGFSQFVYTGNYTIPGDIVLQEHKACRSCHCPDCRDEFPPEEFDAGGNRVRDEILRGVFRTEFTMISESESTAAMTTFGQDRAVAKIPETLAPIPPGLSLNVGIQNKKFTA